MSAPILLTSLQNPALKEVVRLRQRSHRDDNDLLIVEGYREVKRALDNEVPILRLFYCPELYQGKNEPTIVARCAQAGVPLYQCGAAAWKACSPSAPSSTARWPT